VDGLDRTDLRPTRLCGDFVNFRHKKTDLKSVCVSLRVDNKEMVPVGGLDGTDLRPTRLCGDFVNLRHKKTDLKSVCVSLW